jgi:hypothetical protein
MPFAIANLSVTAYEPASTISSGVRPAPAMAGQARRLVRIDPKARQARELRRPAEDRTHAGSGVPLDVRRREIAGARDVGLQTLESAHAGEHRTSESVFALIETARVARESEDHHRQEEAARKRHHELDQREAARTPTASSECHRVRHGRCATAPAW